MTTGERMNGQYGAQGVIMWHRKIGGRWFRFLLVTAGWWGVGETGDLTVSAPISNGQYYPVRKTTLQVPAGISRADMLTLIGA